VSVSENAPKKKVEGHPLIKSITTSAKWIGFFLIILELWHYIRTGEWEW
jgi:hypothetical protein